MRFFSLFTNLRKASTVQSGQRVHVGGSNDVVRSFMSLYSILAPWDIIQEPLSSRQPRLCMGTLTYKWGLRESEPRL
jgi:hypothetical protein